MQSFTYHYKGETVESLWSLSVDNGQPRYKVKLSDDLWFTIVPLIFDPQKDTKIIWHQSNKEGEIVQPHDLVQAMGEGIEASQ